MDLRLAGLSRVVAKITRVAAYPNEHDEKTEQTTASPKVDHFVAVEFRDDFYVIYMQLKEQGDKLLHYVFCNHLWPYSLIGERKREQTSEVTGTRSRTQLISCCAKHCVRVRRLYFGLRLQQMPSLCDVPTELVVVGRHSKKSK